jgi:hypothetical protein
MIRGTENARNLSDSQWFTLMKLVSDDESIDLTLPSTPEEPAVLIRSSFEYRVYYDGTYSVAKARA